MGQEAALECVEENQISLISGPAGTGKSHIAVVHGLRQFLDGEFKKMIFCRPCVEAYGEKLGFLPGDFNTKIAPYMQPIFDIMQRFLPRQDIESFIQSGQFITLPLAYQRGITFSDAFVIGDEFQNTQPSQMKMFLTRIGEKTKVVVTGDPYQSDIQMRNGLSDAMDRLEGIEGVGIVKLTSDDIVRSKIVEAIETRYSPCVEVG